MSDIVIFFGSCCMMVVVKITGYGYLFIGWWLLVIIYICVQRLVFLLRLFVLLVDYFCSYGCLVVHCRCDNVAMVVVMIVSLL